MASSVPAVAPRTRPSRECSRKRTASTKLTEAEFLELEDYAANRGQTLSQWMRQTLFAEARALVRDDLDQDLFTELIGLELLLMHTLAPLVRGERLSAEQYEALVKQVQSVKRNKAMELLAARRRLERR